MENTKYVNLVNNMCEVFQVVGEFLPTTISIRICDKYVKFPMAVAGDWKELRGLTVQINDYHFLAIPVENGFSTYEIMSGMRIISRIDYQEYSHEEDLSRALARYAIQLGCLVEYNKHSMDARITNMQQITHYHCGQRPTVSLASLFR